MIKLMIIEEKKNIEIISIIEVIIFYFLYSLFCLLCFFYACVILEKQIYRFIYGRFGECVVYRQMHKNEESACRTDSVRVTFFASSMPDSECWLRSFLHSLLERVKNKVGVFSSICVLN